MIGASYQTGWVVTLALAICSHAAAQPRIHVRGGSALQITATADHAVLHTIGLLTDDAGAALGGRMIELSIAAAEDAQLATRRTTTRTNAAGAFRYEFAIDDRQDWTVRASFAGDANIDAAQSSTRTQARKTMVTLTIAEPASRRIDLDQDELIVQIRASSAGSLVGASILLRDELGRTLAAGTVDGGDQWRTTISTARLGSPGTGRLIASFGGDAEHASSEVTLDVLRFRATKVTAKATVTSRRIVVAGVVTDSGGRPLSSQTATVVANGRRIATVLTDSEGKFAVTEDDTWPQAPSYRIVAEHESSAPWWIGGRSAPLNVVVPKPWRPGWWLLALVTVTSAALLVLMTRRDRPGRDGGNATRTGAFGSRVDLAQPQPQDSPQQSIRGLVVDSITLRPVVGAAVTCSASKQAFGSVTSVDGAFELLDLPIGNWTLRASAPGYTATSAHVTIPQRGEWTGVRVRLRSLRQSALDHYQRGLVAWLRPTEPAAQLTPREAIALSERHDPGASRNAFQQLATRFEPTYYGAHEPSEAHVERVAADADTVENVIRGTALESFDAPRRRSL